MEREIAQDRELADTAQAAMRATALGGQLRQGLESIGRELAAQERETRARGQGWQEEVRQGQVAAAGLDRQVGELEALLAALKHGVESLLYVKVRAKRRCLQSHDVSGRLAPFPSNTPLASLPLEGMRAR